MPRAEPGSHESPVHIALFSPLCPRTHLGPLLIMNKMKNFKRRLSLSVPRPETIEESLTEFTEQFNQLHTQRNEGEGQAT